MQDPFIDRLNLESASTEWLVYADWLEEQGDARAQFVRELMVLRATTPAERWHLQSSLQELSKDCEPDWLAKTGYITTPFAVESSEFDSVLQAAGPQIVVLDFWAAWCGPCRALRPIVEEVANEVAGWARFGTVDVDEQVELASQFQIEAIPVLLYLKRGIVEHKHVGLQAKEELVKALEELAPSN